MLAVEDHDPDTYDQLDQWVQVFDQQIEWLSRQMDYPMPSNATPPTTKRIDYDAIKERIDLLAYIGQTVKLRKAGNTWKSKCPLPGHDDSTASFTVYPKSNSWWCFGCQRGSDIFDYVRFMYDMRPSELA